jgi:hypothetical protein
MARVALINQAGVDPERLGRIVEAADLPAGDIRLIVGDSKLTQDFQGVCIARPFARYAGNLHGLADHLAESWDCGVIIGSRWAARELEFPAYFAYLLGHELGHAKTVLSDLTLTVYEDLILRYVQRASGRGGWRWDEMPHEIRYDRFGKAVAEDVYGPAELAKEVQCLLDRGLSNDEARLRNLLVLAAEKELVGLRQELADFARPYKAEFLKLWKEDQANGRLKIARGLDFEWLWRLDGDRVYGAP